MKQNNIIIGVLGLAVIVLFILHFTGGRTSSKNDGQTIDSTVVRLPIAYINTDSLLFNYNYAKDLNETLLRKVESSKANLNQRGNKLQADMLEFQRKYDNHAFLSPERAQQEHASLMKRQQDLQTQMEKSQQDLALEQMKMNQQMTDTIVAALKEFNKGPKYQVIFNNAAGNVSTILIADEVYDITAEVTEFLNSRYITPEIKK